MLRIYFYTLKQLKIKLGCNTVIGSRKEGFRLKFTKCTFSEETVKYSVHIIQKKQGHINKILYNKINQRYSNTKNVQNIFFFFR